MALHDAGMSIPQDVSVLSCGTYFEGEPTRFPITEMPVMPEELCAEAMNLLVSAIEEHTDIKGSVELIEPAMKRRGSVAEAGSGGHNIDFPAITGSAERPDRKVANGNIISYG